MKIKIDDEVFKLLQKHAVPLVDTPNSVLRRLLLEDQRFQAACQGVARETVPDDRTGTEEPQSAEPSIATAAEPSEHQRKLIQGLRRIRVDNSNGFGRD
jgi:hypothetical protein